VTQHGGGTIGNQNGFGPKEHTEFLNKGLMVMQKSRWGEVTRRLFEGMACGKLVLCDRLDKSKKLEELFTDGEDIVYYDEMVDCITKMNKYHEDETERNRIAENGYKKVIKNHTQKQRVEFLIKKYKEWESSKIIADDFIIT
jgi:spore maturation protein CgeB